MTNTTSRAATDELLAGLRAGGWRPRTWARFLTLATRRSVHQARLHPRALAEVTVLHAVFAVLGGRRWTLLSWTLAVSHLGMLDARQSLGLPNAVTLVRANLPAIGGGIGRWLPVLALTSDVADGRLARRNGKQLRRLGSHRVEDLRGRRIDHGLVSDHHGGHGFIAGRDRPHPVRLAALTDGAHPPSPTP